MCLFMNVCLFDGPCFWCKKPLLLLLCEASAHNEKPMAKLLETYCVVCSNKGKFKGVNQVQKNQFIPISRLLQMKLSYLFGGLGMTEWLVRSSSSCLHNRTFCLVIEAVCSIIKATETTLITKLTALITNQHEKINLPPQM